MPYLLQHSIPQDPNDQFCTEFIIASNKPFLLIEDLRENFLIALVCQRLNAAHLTRMDYVHALALDDVDAIKQLLGPLPGDWFLEKNASASVGAKRWTIKTRRPGSKGKEDVRIGELPDPEYVAARVFRYSERYWNLIAARTKVTQALAQYQLALEAPDAAAVLREDAISDIVASMPVNNGRD